VASLQLSHSFEKKLQNAEVRAVQTPTTLCYCCGNAAQSHRTPCRGVYLKHAQNKRRGLVFPQHVRQHAEAMLWGLLECRGCVVGAPRARCKDTVKLRHLEQAMHFDKKTNNHKMY